MSSQRRLEESRAEKCKLYMAWPGKKRRRRKREGGGLREGTAEIAGF